MTRKFFNSKFNQSKSRIIKIVREKNQRKKKREELVKYLKETGVISKDYND